MVTVGPEERPLVPDRVTEAIVTNLHRVAKALHILTEELDQLVGYATAEHLQREHLEQQLERAEAFIVNLKDRIEKARPSGGSAKRTQTKRRLDQ